MEQIEAWHLLRRGLAGHYAADGQLALTPLSERRLNSGLTAHSTAPVVARSRTRRRRRKRSYPQSWKRIRTLLQDVLRQAFLGKGTPKAALEGAADTAHGCIRDRG
jgi:hypothetical protein